MPAAWAAIQNEPSFDKYIDWDIILIPSNGKKAPKEFMFIYVADKLDKTKSGWLQSILGYSHLVNNIHVYLYFWHAAVQSFYIH